MSLASPRIAVILPVYNAEAYVAEAIRSVLEQTYTDFRLIVIDDGSTDRSLQIVNGFSDPRVQLIRLAANQGLVSALNTGIAESASELIARMDADDVCLPGRFERQVAFLDAHPNVMICGTWTEVFGTQTCVRRPPSDPRRIQARLFFGFAMDHPSIMLRRAFLERHDLGYREEYRHVEDVDLFVRASACGDLANVPEVLLRTRAHDTEISAIHVNEQVDTEARLRIDLLRQLMPAATAEDAAFHVAMLEEEIPVSAFPGAEQWLARLGDTNRGAARYDVHAFNRELYGVFWCLHAKADLGIAEVVAFWRSPIASHSGRRVLDTMRLCGQAGHRFIRRVGRAVLGRS
ncbi:MAG: glycosyltransferase family 2 protein [Vicinamibacterales bacterium]|nr:glycosyltransferase family 2 protein [Vicinamibacterales bacterium]